MIDDLPNAFSYSLAHERGVSDRRLRGLVADGALERLGHPLQAAQGVQLGGAAAPQQAEPAGVAGRVDLEADASTASDAWRAHPLLGAETWTPEFIADGLRDSESTL